MFEFLAERNPSDILTALINLDSGEVADESLNIFEVQTIRESLIQSVPGTSGFDYKFIKKDMAITIKTNASVNTEDRGRVLSSVFFFKLIVIIQPEEIIDAFSYGLYTRPSSLLGRKDLMNETHKPEFKNALFDPSRLSECAIPDILQDTDSVLDGGVIVCCKDVYGLLEAQLMNYVNPSKPIWETTMG